VENLVFVLDGALRNIPISALYDGEEYLLENYAIAFGIGAAHWHIDESSATLGYLHSWATHLINNAGVKLIPLGQTTGQELLL
jgi:urease accessory protein UreF